jgi:hypothetical protein
MTTKQEIGPNQRKWLDALRSGNYKQGKEELCCNGMYCCLGVASELFEEHKQVVGDNIIFGDKISCAPPSVVFALLLYSDTGSPKLTTAFKSLVSLNDSMGKSFTEIADIVESDPSIYFREPQ